MIMIWSNGSELSDKIFNIKPHRAFICTAQELSKFSISFTNDIEKYNHSPELVWLDDSGGFKVRCPFVVDGSAACWDKAVAYIENGFGNWCGFAHHPNVGYYFESCNGNKLVAIPEKGATQYRIKIQMKEGEISCNYLEFFQDLAIA